MTPPTPKGSCCEKKVKYKDAASYQCPCGREIAVPYPSMTRNIAPSDVEMKQVSQALLIEVTYHQNKECPWMHNERVKALTKTTV